MTRDRGLQPIGSSLDDFLERLGMPTAVDLATIVDSWSSVAGEPFASSSAPTGLRDRELVISVSDGSTASLLKYQIGGLVDRLSTHFGEGVVDRVKIRVQRDKNAL